jgi:L-ribulokinase
MGKKFVIGIDYGTDSVRSVVVDTTNGKIMSDHLYLSIQDGKRVFL